MEVDELGHNDRNIDYEVQRERAIEKQLGCVFIWVNPDEESFNIFSVIIQIHRHIKKSTKKSLIEKISKILLKLEFKSNHSIITKSLKRVVKKLLPDYKQWKTQINDKTDKNWKAIWSNVLFWVYMKNFRPENVKMTNKVVRGKSHCVVCWSSKLRFLKQKIN